MQTTNFSTTSLDCLPISNTTAQINLASSTPLTYTVPGTNAITYRCEISVPYNASVWLGFNVAAVFPSLGTVTSNSNIELIGHDRYVRYVRGGDVLSFNSNAAVTDIGISLLKLQG